jgi:hypothetical protein
LTKLLADNAPKAMKEQKFESYFGRKIAVDASMSIYQFLVCSAPTPLVLISFPHRPMLKMELAVLLLVFVARIVHFSYVVVFCLCALQELFGTVALQIELGLGFSIVKP